MATATFDELAKSVSTHDYRPVYLLMGAEAYYIDKACALFEKGILTDEESEMNLTILYGKDVTAETIMGEARRYPVMAERQIVIVKEMQGMDDDPDKLIPYVRRAAPTTILVLCHKGGNIDKRKKITDEVSRAGMVFVSDKIKEAALPAFINTYVRSRRATIEADAATLLAEYVGNDLGKVTNELDKLLIRATAGNITHDMVASGIGMTHDFTPFDLREALIAKDFRRANIIAAYMEEHTKTFPVQPILALLFSYFSNLMLAYYAPQKSPSAIASYLKLRSEWQVRDYERGMRAFSGKKTMLIIDSIRQADARSKGQGGMGEHVLRDLVHFILH